MKLLAVFAAVITAATVCSDLSNANEVKKSQYPRYMRFARGLAQRIIRKHALLVFAIVDASHEWDVATIRYLAVDTAVYDCIGRVEFLGGGFRRPKYLDGIVCRTVKMRPTDVDTYAVILTATVFSDFSDAWETVVTEPLYWPYIRFARKLALIGSEKYAKRVITITKVEREGNEAIIRFEAMETTCKRGKRIPSRRRCPYRKNAPINYCTGVVKFLGGSFRRVKYPKKIICL
ncbi:hypothetical protein MTO96_007212 [Rhipicephalus appendiculatus]